MLPIVDDCGLRPGNGWNARRHPAPRIRSIDSTRIHPETNMDRCPEGTLANLHTSGITGQGLVSREAMDGILLQAAQTGAPTAAFLRGTFKCFFKPDWTSGQGPGRHATLAGFGQWKVPPDMTGYWGITMDPTESNCSWESSRPREERL